MKCINCGHEYPIGKFCPSCGTPAPEASTQSSLAADFEEQPVFETYANPEPETYAPQAEAPAPTYHPPVTPVMPAKRKHFGAVIAVILALVLIAGAVIGVLALAGNGPANAIGGGLKKVLKSETFNFDVTLDVEGETMNYVGTIEFNPEEYILNVYMDASYTGDDEKVTLCIYDGQAFSVAKDGSDKYYEYAEIDEDTMEEFFDYYLEYADLNPNKKDDVLIILEEIDDLSDGELSEIVDLDVLAECITEYVGAHNDKKWLEENAGFSQEKKDGTTYYTYEPNLYELADASLPFFEEAFEDEDVYEEGVELIEDSRGDMKNISLEITFGVKSGYLTSVAMDVEGAQIEVEFSDFGKAELDYDELDDLASECKKGYEKQMEEYCGYYD